jgi:hypothetical protein
VAANGFATVETESVQHDGAVILSERGAALMMLLMVLALVSIAIILDRPVQVLPARLERDAITARSLSDAKRALIAWSVTLSPAAGKSVAPGLLPFPDRHRDGNYDGKGDCVTFGLNDSHLLGRLPWAGDAKPCPHMGLNIDVRDGDGEHLWYAVSRNLLVRGRGGFVNPDMGKRDRAVYPWIRLRNARGELITEPDSAEPLAVAAVIIAPGSAMQEQNRSGPAPRPAEFLDTVKIGVITFDNADADGCPDVVGPPCGSPPSGEEFIVYPDAPAGSGFNDRLTYITVAELMRAVEKRVLGEAALALTRYRDAFGAYPWLAKFHSSEAGASMVEPSFKSTLARDGLLPVHLPYEIFSTRFDGSWNFIDSTPSTVTRHSGDMKLVPPLVDGMSGSIRVASESGRCVWSDWTRGDCIGSRLIPAYYRIDLGTTVMRTVEYSFSIIDDTPRVIPPTSADVRRRSVSVDAITLPKSSSTTWSIRITDEDGVSKGQRDILIDADTGGEIALDGIRYDLSVVYDDVDDARDELPEWFARNNWHHFMFVAVSRDAVAGGNADGDGDCSTPVNSCLTLNVSGKVARSDVRALLVSSGAQLLLQDRSVGDCDGDRTTDDVLCAYLEGDNSDRSTPALGDTYARGDFSFEFNDQLRIVDPLPP